MKKNKGFEIGIELGDAYPREWRKERLNELVQECDKAIYVAEVQIAYFNKMIAAKPDKGIFDALTGEVTKIREFSRQKAEWKKFLQEQCSILEKKASVPSEKR